MSIGTYSFANCTSLQKISFPDSLSVIGESAFYKCYNLLSVNLPKGLTKIKDYAFQHCNKLVDVKNESTLNVVADSKSTDNGYVGAYAKEIHNGESKIVEQNGYYFYSFSGTNYLMGCSDMTLTSLNLPSDFGGKSYVIYKYAFSFRPNLQSVTVTAGAEQLNGNSFYSCSNFSTLTLSTSVTSINQNALNVCPAFNSIIFIGSESEFNAISIHSTNSILLAAQIEYRVS